MIWKKPLFILFALAFMATAQAAVVNRIAAVVNDEVITTLQLDKKLALHQDEVDRMPAAKKSSTRKTILNALIEETLVRQRIKELHIQVSDGELEAALEDIQKKNGDLTREQLIAAIEQQGMSFREYRENMRQKLLQVKLVGQEVRKKIIITAADVRDYFDAHRTDYDITPMVNLGYLVFLLDDHANQEDVRTRALDIQQQLSEGADFKDILNSVDGDQSIKSGSLGMVRVKDLSPVYADAVRDLPAGGVSDVLEISNSLRLFFVAEKSSGEKEAFEHARSAIERKLMDERLDQGFKKWAEDLREQARIEILL